MDFGATPTTFLVTCLPATALFPDSLVAGVAEIWSSFHLFAETDSFIRRMSHRGWTFIHISPHGLY